LKIGAYSRNCGALVEDMQLSEATDREVEILRNALANHGVLFFREQEFSPEDHLTFAKRFGEIVRNKFFQPVDGFPDIAEVRKEPNQTTNIGGGWHTDHSYDDAPALGSILVARELPKAGGATLFANMHAAWEALPRQVKAQITQLEAIHSNEHIYGHGGYYSQTDLGSSLNGAEDVGQAVQPVVVRHPVTGANVLYVNPAHTIAIKNMDKAESADLLEKLYAHAQQKDFQCHFEWQPGSVALWDNRLTWHLAENDYDGERRLMHRITLAGEPLSAAA